MCFLGFGSILGPDEAINLLLRLWCLIFAVRACSHRNDQTPKSVTLPARNGIGSSEQRNKWLGPACGKDAVYAGCDLEPIPLRAPKPELSSSAKAFSPVGWPPLFCAVFGFAAV
jgi:hypothetical protein